MSKFKPQRDPRGHSLRTYSDVYDSPAFSALSPHDVLAYMALLRELKGYNNGDLSLPLTRAKNCGISHLTLARTHVFTCEGNLIVQVNTKAWRNALQRAGILDFRWHDLRHTFATWHREAGTPTHELQRLGGWKTQSMVERYAHVAPEGLQLAASRLDSMLRPYH